jgi:plastocyanin
MRKAIVAMLLLPVLLAACGSDDKNTTANSKGTSATTAGSSDAPVDVASKITAHGTKDASALDKLEVEADDYYFGPTYIKVKAGQKLTLEVKNEGKATHTFTSDALGVDKELKPGESADVEITVPATDASLFYCRFHQGSGMQGVVYTKEGASVGASTGGGDSSTTAGNGY